MKLISKLALVDGALGHTGSFLVKYLIEYGWNVVATDLQSEIREKIMTKEKVFGTHAERLDCRSWESVEYISADLTEKDSLSPLFDEKTFKKSDTNKKNYDVIFHTASLYDYGAPYDLLHEVNYSGLQNLLEIMFDYAERSRTNVPLFVHWSTCGVYGEPAYQKDEEGFIYPIDEKAPFNPPNNYSQTKVEQEKLIFRTAEENSDFNYIILRSAPIYGPYQTYGMFHVFFTPYVMGHSVLPKIFPKNRKLMMPMIHVIDLVNAAIFLAEKDAARNEIFNVVSDSPLQEHFLEYLYKELGITFTTFPTPWFLFKLYAKLESYIAERKAEKAKKYNIRPKFDAPMVKYLNHQYYFSNKKLTDLGFEFEYNDYKKGIRDTVKWYRDHDWLPVVEINDPDYVNREPRPAITPEKEYKTPMEGGEVFE